MEVAGMLPLALIAPLTTDYQMTGMSILISNQINIDKMYSHPV